MIVESEKKNQNLSLCPVILIGVKLELAFTVLLPALHYNFYTI